MNEQPGCIHKLRFPGWDNVEGDKTECSKCGKVFVLRFIEEEREAELVSPRESTYAE